MNPKTHHVDITEKIIRDHGLTKKEYQQIKNDMGRPPNLIELGIFSVMWSEHCSYKSSRKFLSQLPTSGSYVIQGPGENAGVIDIGDGQAAIFKMESHNHPSFIEPYQGAATGVGGIMRDIFTMGARPIANLNALRFGHPHHPKTRHLVSEVIAGIGGYGNCMGVPTVGGEVNFDESYNGNILVNTMCVGITKIDKIFYATATGVGYPVIYVGSKTGRDGIHGATMASIAFNDTVDQKRPTVQVGDPFTEKLLLEACLELMASDAIIAIQDMGAAGLTSSSVEMASKGGVGIDLNLDHVPCRENGMTAYEILLSESQERMLMVLKKDREKEAKEIFQRWGLNFAVIGILTDDRHMIIRHNNQIVVDMPLAPLTSGAPVYERPYTSTSKKPAIKNEEITHKSLEESFKILMGSPDLVSRRWIWEQYDHMVMCDTLVKPGHDAAVIRIHNTEKGLALSNDVTPRYCYADPLEGGKQAVAESWRNLTAIGATPLAITNCLNFGNPERPEIMGQFVDTIKGIKEACENLQYPVVSGNVSLYNETNGQSILPTPTIGGVGLILDIHKISSLAFNADEIIYLIGKTQGHLGCSLYLRDVIGKKTTELGNPPLVNLVSEKQNGDFIRQNIQSNLLSIVHDVSDGGVLIALAEMALAGNCGFQITHSPSISPQAFFFGEDQSRYLITMNKDKTEAFEKRAKQSSIVFTKLGLTGGKKLILNGNIIMSVEALCHIHEDWLPTYMNTTG